MIDFFLRSDISLLIKLYCAINLKLTTGQKTGSANGRWPVLVSVSETSTRKRIDHYVAARPSGAARAAAAAGGIYLNKRKTGCAITAYLFYSSYV